MIHLDSALNLTWNRSSKTDSLIYSLCEKKSSSIMAPPPSDLSRAISTGNYRLAKRLARQFRFMVSEWSKQTVFINDEALSTKMLPLHQAAGDPDASFRFIQVILELYPSAAWKFDSSGKRLPLHWACEAGAALNVIELLLEYYPEAVATPDAQGRLPLHLAVMQRNKCVSGLLRNTKKKHHEPSSTDNSFLREGSVEVGGGEISATDNEESKKSIMIGTVLRLLQADPLIARGQDRTGQTPLALACRHGAPLRIVQELISAFPEACLAHSQRSPLVIICKQENRNGSMSFYDNEEEGNQVLFLVQETQQRLERRMPNLQSSSFLESSDSMVLA